MIVNSSAFETNKQTLKEERRLCVFENRNLRRIFEPKRDANGDGRRLYNEEFQFVQFM